MIGFGIRLVVRSIRGSRTRASIEPSHPEPYRTFGASLHDFRALDDEQVESFRQLMRSAAVNCLTKPFSIMNWAKVVKRPCFCRQRW